MILEQLRLEKVVIVEIRLAMVARNSSYFSKSSLTIQILDRAYLRT